MAVRDALTLFPKSTDNTLAISGTTFKISSTGAVTFVSGQTFPGTGTITGITTASGSGLSGGGTTGTLSLKVPAAGITNAMLANSKITLNASTAGGLTVPGAMTLGDSYLIGLKTCSTNQVLQYNGTAWACASAGTGTVTSVGSGAGLTGGPITGTGSLSIASAGVTNTMLQNSTFTLSPGGGMTGGGAVALGGSTTLGLKTCAANQVLEYIGSVWTCSTPAAGTITDVNTGTVSTTGLTGGGASGTVNLSVSPSVIPFLADANTFTNTQTVNSNMIVSANINYSPAINVSNVGGGDGIDVSEYDPDGTGIYSNNTGSGGAAVGGTGSYGGIFTGSVEGVSGYEETDEAFLAGVFGVAGSENGNQATLGVTGSSLDPVGIGVSGIGDNQSITSQNTDIGYFAMGVWGDSGNQDGIGVFATTDTGWPFVGYNNSDYLSTTWFENLSITTTAPVLFATGAYGSCTSNVSGDFSCTGSYAAVAPVDGGTKKVALNAIHSPENWFEDVGSAQLSGGEAVVNIESVFGETVNTGMDYHVFLTPNGDCKGLFVAQKSASSFVVKELGGGSSSIAFDYRIIAKRKGFEQIRLADETQTFSLKNRPIKPAGSPAKHMPSTHDRLKKIQALAQHRPVARVGAPVLNK
jgi:hypothetical protein